MRLMMGTVLVIAALPVAGSQLNDTTKQLAHEILRQLVETDTTDSRGDTTAAAESIRARLLGAGFPQADVYLGGPNPRKTNLVARIRGTSKRKPILFIGHLDVMEAGLQDPSADPFKLVEKDGYFYGRGTLHMKAGDAMLVTTMIRLKRERYKPDRDIVIALTADEEGGRADGFDWLLKNHHALIDAEFIINAGAGSFEMEKGRRLLVGVQITEKLYQDFELKVTNAADYSSTATNDNPIYHLIDGLTRIEHYTFPFELNETTRAYFQKMSALTSGPSAEDMKAILAMPANAYAVGRISKAPFYYGITHTACVVTALQATYSYNALPQTATAIVNCRILPGRTSEEVRRILVKVMDEDEPEITVTSINSPPIQKPTPPTQLRPDVILPLETVVNEMWPGVPVVPVLETNPTDAVYSRSAGIPTYGISGVWMDVNDDRSFGSDDERISVPSFNEGVDFFYRFIKALSVAQAPPNPAERGSPAH